MVYKSILSNLFPPSLLFFLFRGQWWTDTQWVKIGEYRIMDVCLSLGRRWLFASTLVMPQGMIVRNPHQEKFVLWVLPWVLLKVKEEIRNINFPLPGIKRDSHGVNLLR